MVFFYYLVCYDLDEEIGKIYVWESECISEGGA